MAQKNIMSVEIVRNAVPVSGIEDGLKFGETLYSHSFGPAGWKSCMHFCAMRGRMAFLDELVDVRHEGNGTDNCNKSHLSGTLVGYVAGETTGYVLEPSIEVLREMERLLPAGNCYLDIEKDSDLGSVFLGSARNFMVPEKDLILPVAAREDGSSVYDTNETVRVFLPRSARQNAEIMRRRGLGHGRIWFYRGNVPAEKVRVCSVGLGGGGGVVVDVDAGDDFGGNGWARSVVHVGAQKRQ